MSPSAREYLQHIVDECTYLISQAQGLTQTQFLHDETLKRAFARSVEIIGEAVKHIPDDIRVKYSQIEWRVIGRMRDKLIHDYFGVDYDIVWDVVRQKVPFLHQTVLLMIKEGESAAIDVAASEDEEA